MNLFSIVAALAGLSVQPQAATAIPAPASAPAMQRARAHANLASLISHYDYPPNALGAQLQWRVEFNLTVGPDGRVTDCTVTSSSGIPAIDRTTCRLMRARARFTPARDADGAPTTDVHSTFIAYRR